MLNGKRVAGEVSFLYVVPSYCVCSCVLLLYSEFTDSKYCISYWRYQSERTSEGRVQSEEWLATYGVLTPVNSEVSGVIITIVGISSVTTFTYNSYNFISKF
jgi:hypothetical protein